MTDAGKSVLAALLAELSTIARQAGTPLVVHAVTGDARTNSRVIRSAGSSARAGFTTVVLASTDADQPEAVDLPGVTALLLPRPATTDTRALAERWHQLARWLPAFRALRTAAATLRTRRPPTRAMARGIVRSDTAGRDVPDWARLDGQVLGQNLALAEALAVLQPDLTHVHDARLLPAAVVHAAGRRARGRGARTLYDPDDAIPQKAKSHRTSTTYDLLQRIERQYIGDVDAVIATGGRIAKLLRQTYSLPTLPKVVANVPSRARDTSAPDLRGKLGLDPDTPLAIYAGQVAAGRGVASLVRALPGIPELHLALVCDAPRPAVFEAIRLARSLGVLDRVHVAGEVPPGQTTQYLAAGTVGVIPFERGRDFDMALPPSFGEFLHAGLPVVASDHEVLAEQIAGTGVGEVFETGDVPGLVAALRRVLADPDRYRRAITAGLLATHSWETQEKVLLDAYRRLAGEPGADLPPADLAPALRRVPGLRHDEAGPTSPMDRPYAAFSLGIGRSNAASQAYRWAESATAHLGVRAGSFARARAVQHPAHYEIAPGAVQPARAAAELARIITSYTHVLIDGFRSIAWQLLADDIEPEIAVLRRHGIKVGLVAHGSDVRDPALHLARFPDSYFRYVPADWLESESRRAARNREIAAAFDGPVFASTPDLLHHVPGATWLPVVIDVDQWAGLPPIQPGRKPRVLHRPSRSKPPIKGSEVIVPVLEDLHRRGIIDYLADPGEVPAARMTALVEDADIVVDQIRTGSYGVAAVEAMAAGRVVVGNLEADVRSFVADPVPIVDATSEDLESVLTALAGDPDRITRLAAEGRQFAATWHSGEVSARVIAGFLAD